jgi:hypothetical protein
VTEFALTVDAAVPGADSDLLDRLADHVYADGAMIGAALGLDLEQGLVSATFNMQACSLDEAIREGTRRFGNGLAAVGAPRELVAISAAREPATAAL